MLSEAAQDKDPKVFWHFLKTDRRSPNSETKLDDWVQHFSTLLNPQSDNDYENEHFEQEDALTENEHLDRLRKLKY